MTAVAVVTPSSGSNSAAVLLLWVVGADTCPSLFVAPGRRDRRALSSCGDPRGRVRRRLHPGRPVFDRSPRERVPPYGGRVCPGATTEDRTAGGSGGVVGLVRRVPPGGGARPGGRSPRRTYRRSPSRSMSER